MFDVLRMVLCEYPDKLSLSAQGNRAELNVPLTVVLGADGLSDVVDAMIERRLNAAAYASLREYFVYFRAVTGVDVSAPEFDSYVEIKATRDVLVHNSGIVNTTYLEKAGAAKRAKVGTPIPIDRPYYDGSITVLKRLAGLVNEGGW